MGHAIQLISPMVIQRNYHINVEACRSIKTIKYLFKYIYKGHDQTSMARREADKEDNEANIDEIKQYVTPRCYAYI